MKRIFDLVAAVLGLIILSPVFIITAFLVRINLGAPILFKQYRPGLHGRLFKMYKFRTMSEDRNSLGELLADRERILRFGNILRSSSLDELPELWNVLKGEMSLVGPRPLLMEYLELYTPEQARRHEVRPGITGWAQINGRNALSWEEKFKLDIWYVDNRSLWLDLKIIFITINKVFVRAGINQEGEATMKAFKGKGGS